MYEDHEIDAITDATSAYQKLIALIGKEKADEIVHKKLERMEERKNTTTG